MIFNNHRYLCRSGPQDRIHVDRFMYLKGLGWFVYVRGDTETYDGIEVSSGIAGPFSTKYDARRYLTGLIDKMRQEIHTA